jgi:tetratricopeptide (TPR) repeat protein
MVHVSFGALVLAAFVALPVAAAGQTPQSTDKAPLPDMQAIARALGVSCTYCHVQGDFAADTNPKKLIAREMIAMTRTLNATIQSATGKAAGQVTTVQCATCHRGRAVPRTLTDTLWTTIVEKGPDAAVEQYRELRAKFYAKDTYDFSDTEFLNFLARVAESRPDAALPLLRMNLEFNPKSASTYIVMSRAYQRKRDKVAAVEMLRKALEIEPENGVAQGLLYQLEPRR